MICYRVELIMRIGFDFDGTLHKAPQHEAFFKLMAPVLNQHELFVLTTRDTVDSKLMAHVAQLGLKVDHFMAMGKQMSMGLFETKAHFMKCMNTQCDMFFDNDPYEIDALRKLGIPCMWVPEMDQDSLMWEITEGFFGERKNEIV